MSKVVITEAGRKFLRDKGIDPDSIGSLEEFQQAMAAEGAKPLNGGPGKSKRRGFWSRLFRSRKPN